MKSIKSVALFAFVSMVAAIPAHATLLTSNSLSGATVINFDDQPNQLGTIGAVQIGGAVGQNVTVSSSSASNGLYFNYNGWGLLTNGTWGQPKTYVSLNGRTDSMLFAFNDGPVSAVGGFMNYAKGSDLIITALDASMATLETYDISSLADIVTPNGYNAGAFRGIQRGASDIAFFRISGGEANTLDDLTFVAGASSVPEPASLALLGIGLMGLGLARRKKA